MTKHTSHKLQHAEEPDVAARIPRPQRLNRAAKAEATRTALFDAAIEIVGEFGYAGTSVARITERAKVAQGTFYNYFDSRQDLLDQLLPAISRQLLAHVRARVLAAPDNAVAREYARIKGFFEFLERTPHLFKILHEGEIQAPEGFRRHVLLQSTTYEKALEYERRRGNLRIKGPEEIATITQMLMGARAWLSSSFCVRDGEVLQPPDHVIDTYMQFVARGLFIEEDEVRSSG